MTDINNHWYILNIKLQGKNQNIFQLVGHVEGFCNKLFCCDPFFFMQQLLGEGKSIDFLEFFKKFKEISDEFNNRFTDFDLLKAEVELFNNPMEENVKSQPPYLLQELCELQLDPFLLSKKNERYNAFWKLISKE